MMDENDSISNDGMSSKDDLENAELTARLIHGNDLLGIEHWDTNRRFKEIRIPLWLVWRCEGVSESCKRVCSTIPVQAQDFHVATFRPRFSDVCQAAGCIIGRISLHG